MKNVVILGSTGSIGKNALRVIEALPSRFRIVGLAVSQNFKSVLRQAEQFKVKHVAVADAAMARACASVAPRGVKVHHGPAGVEELAGMAGVDIVLCSVVGLAGLKPVMAAVKNGTDVALATKEVLVAAGNIVTAACRRSGSLLLPVDSEHSAIFQCLGAKGREERRQPPSPRLRKSGFRSQNSGIRDQRSEARGRNPETGNLRADYLERTDGGGVRKLILTASGGPFMTRPGVDFDRVTVRQALAHPTWNMGKKVTIDSATLMNKGLEIMEAQWLFNVPVDRIDVIVHPESIVHSMVEFDDGNMIAQMSVPDMRYAIQYAFTYPERLDAGLPALDLARTARLTFMVPDEKRFPCLGLAREAARCGGTMPAVLNAANEVAVERFLARGIGFSGIWKLVEKVMSRHKIIRDPDLEEIIAVHEWAKRTAL